MLFCTDVQRLRASCAGPFRGIFPYGEKRVTTILLHKPEAGQNADVFVQPGQTYRFDFDTEEASFDSEAADVVVTFDDGATLHLKDFLRVTAHDDFTISLSDGACFSAKDMADMFEMVLEDFHTDGLTAANDAGAAPAPEGGDALLVADAGLSGLLGKGEPAPLCADICRIPDHDHDLFGDPEYLITPHAEAGAFTPPAADRIGHASYPPVTAPGETLQIEDLLDTSSSLLLESPHTPAFESLLDSPFTGPGQAVRPSDCIVQTDGAPQDPFLLALFGLGPV